MKIPNIMICSALAATLAACGSAAKTTDATANKTVATAGGDAAKLTDAAADSATADATTTAEANDAAGDDAGTASSTEAPAPADSTASAELPSFLDVVRQARDYTRKLLGIDDSALKTFKAEVATARALSDSPEEFKANIASAQDEFQAALEAQKTASDDARVANKDALDAIYKGTVQVFLACGADVSLGEHQGRGDEQGPGRPEKGEKGGKRPPPPRGHGKGGEGHGRPGDQGGEGHGRPGDQGGDDEQGQRDAQGDDQGDLSSDQGGSPRMMFGNGEFNGNFGSFMRHFNGKGKLGLASDAGASSECSAAVSALQVLVTPAS